MGYIRFVNELDTLLSPEDDFDGVGKVEQKSHLHAHAGDLDL